MNSHQGLAPARAYFSRGWVLGQIGCWAFLLLVSGMSAGAAGGALEIHNNYFWDPATQDYFIPRGFGYQTLNPEVGATQTPDQLDYDLRAFKRLYVNSLRVDMPWSEIETNRGQFAWDKTDYLVDKAEEMGLRLFVLIGFQYSAKWFPTNWLGINEEGKAGFIVNYEHPEMRAAYSNYIYQVTDRYKNRTVIGAWILGNEYSYFDLWNATNKLYFGYDEISLASFQRYLAQHYQTNIAGLNKNWTNSYTSFDEVEMPPTYPSNRRDSRYYDLTQWRKHSIGDLVSVGAVAARKADQNHLLTYSMIGGIFSGDDSKFTCEDEKVILEHCAAAGVPLQFWSVNNYAYTAEGDEMRSADYGVAKYQELVGLPVLLTETGHSSTDDIYTEERVRHAKALPTQLWEGLLSGAMGVHIFTWNDRHKFGESFFLRERGFGIVNQDRTIKSPVYANVVETFRRMDNLNLNRLLGDSANPPTDVNFFWSTNADMVWPRANQEQAMLWGALRRLGYQPGIVQDDKLAAGAATNAPALILSRCWIMDPAQLDAILTNVLPAGIHIFADADLPGELDQYQKKNPTWASKISTYFGLNVSGAAPGYDEGVRSVDYFGRVDFQVVNPLGGLTNGYNDHVGTWKIYHGVKSASGTTRVTHRGNNSTQLPMPALQTKVVGPAKTAITTFALADTDLGESPKVSPPSHRWDVRYTWLEAIFKEWFQVKPAIELTGSNATHVQPDYRMCSNGSILIGLLNESTNAASVHLSAPGLLSGKTVENLTSGGIMANASGGSVDLEMEGDDYVLLYAYDSARPSLINPSPNKVWIDSAPVAIYPDGGSREIQLGLDLQDTDLSLGLSLERLGAPNIIYAQTNVGPVTGKGRLTVPLFVKDSDLKDPWFVSSFDGAQYQFHAWLQRGGVRVADSYLATRLLWGVKPISFPSVVQPGVSAQVTLGWEELASYLPEEGPTTLQRAEAWEPYKSSRQYYRMVLELRAQDQVVATSEYAIGTATGQHTFTIKVPTNAIGPFSWTSYIQRTPWASVDFVDGFEDRDGGNRTDGVMFAPWAGYPYSENNTADLLDYGVGIVAIDGSKAAFLVATNPASSGSFAGFGMIAPFPQAFAIPRTPAERTNYNFSAWFMEQAGLPCVLELQVKDTNGGMIHFLQEYKGTGGWDKIEASLDKFVIPDYVGMFDPDNVSNLVVNIQMTSKPALYVGFVDDVAFTGPHITSQIASPQDLFEGFEEHPKGDKWDYILPWAAYYYPPEGPRWTSTGVGTAQGLDGSAAAFLIVTNPPNIDFSGFGLGYNFPTPWQLPKDKRSWTNYVFSYDFRETGGRSCVMEMQVKSGANNWIEFTSAYTNPGWKHLEASLDQFEQPSGVGDFNPDNVIGIVVNIRMVETGAEYFGQFDNIFFNGPDSIVPINEPWEGFYDSNNDSAETSETLTVDVIQVVPQGVLLSWPARSDRAYSVYFQDQNLSTDPGFLPVPNLSGLTSTTGRISVTDTSAVNTSTRFYRVTVQKF